MNCSGLCKLKVTLQQTNTQLLKVLCRLEDEEGRAYLEYEIMQYFVKTLQQTMCTVTISTY